ncbi:hypothetical protein GLIP_4252 [Aliiglaciecola lipolytica E3]|uniref:Uncharacterized protein n=1 Tax=Aliiglaciecola lipolytica E3 TaxID=1127673 RepID=K6YJT9_9ALTE|nr:hypothetical protein GLIP_4252 [Aliiglaciecola lipolytica E3]
MNTDFAPAKAVSDFHQVLITDNKKERSADQYANLHLLAE